MLKKKSIEIRLAVNCSGLSLIEFMVVLSVVGILATAGITSVSDSIERNRVIDATESIYGLMERARTEGQIRDKDLSFNTITSTTPWCAGYSAEVNCDCSITTSCVLDVAGTKVLQILSGARFRGITLAENFASGGGTTFSRIRGHASRGGTVSVSSNNWRLNIVVSSSGRIRVCNPWDDTRAIAGYLAC